MFSVYLKAPEDICLRHTAEPRPRAGEALLRVRAAGICGSDIGAYRGTNPLVRYPRVLGHEIAAEVLSVPENRAGIAAGDHVLVNPYLYCGGCYPCGLGRTNCCTGLEVLGVHRDGGMAGQLCHPASMLVKLPPGLPWALAPLAEPLAIALHGLGRGRLAAGEHVAILGAGPIGLLAAMAARQAGAVPVVVDPVEERLEKAASLGVAHAFTPGAGLAEQVAALTGGRMAQLVLEASGANEAILSALSLAAHAGRVVLTGWPKQPTPLPTEIITRKELDVLGARTAAGELEQAVGLIASGSVDAGAILSEAVPAEQLPEMVRRIAEQPGRYLKVVGLF